MKLTGNSVPIKGGIYMGVNIETIFDLGRDDNENSESKDNK
jgi:hypothetical protein